MKSRNYKLYNLTTEMRNNDTVEDENTIGKIKFDNRYINKQAGEL